MTQVDPRPPDPTKFPLPQWGTYDHYNGFKAHKTLAAAKTTLTNACFKGYRRDSEKDGAMKHGYLYEFVNGAWTLKHAIQPGDEKDTHPIWAKPFVIKERLEGSDLTSKKRRRT